ncbi:GNAT family N-acetyltransferase [Kitasatospora paracochleata]|uniref:RimJ/RimL family protein N-acetyltransferase n=1 Tax=Kitasatospora paracochleata TaxID=58354 RepID=A0ABT1J5U6_9ACTN|nr:GNAT family N-acetyltransferase [Kitasatospora paracochleata]MCP2312493.1 RimJ/RimL family protein N-acetyltransferase [Kitasatospora paracochleata]
MLFRPTVEADLDRVLSCTVTEPVSWADPDRYRRFLADGSYRPAHTWIAEDASGRLLARAVWWTFPDGERPLALDCVWVDDSVADPAALAAELLGAAHAAFGPGELPEYHLFLPPDWRADPAVADAVDRRREAARRAGLGDALERVRYAWTADAPVPPASGALVFAPASDADFVEAFRRVAAGSLDDDTRRGLARTDPLTQARETLADYLSMPGDRAWWRLARTPDGALAGVALPSANQGGPVVGYLGVVPELRGRGLVDGLLAEITRSHAERGASRIGADTDLGNTPMAAAFERAGYRAHGVRLVLREPLPA